MWCSHRLPGCEAAYHLVVVFHVLFPPSPLLPRPLPSLDAVPAWFNWENAALLNVPKSVGLTDGVDKRPRETGHHSPI